MTYNSIEHWLPPRVSAREAAPLLREVDPDSYTTIVACLPCASRQCHTCYGEGCECGCGGDRVGE